jgi:adenosylcobyric acid synthase
VSLDDGRVDGALSRDGQIFGTYLHGIFDGVDSCGALLRWMGLRNLQPMDYASLREQAIDRVADALESHLDLPALLQPLGSTT